MQGRNEEEESICCQYVIYFDVYCTANIPWTQHVCCKLQN